MNEPLVHVLVINWNGREHLEACFTSLLAQPYRRARFVLVDNASGDGSVEYVQNAFGHDPRVEVLICPGNLGWSGGNNFAIKHALEAGAEYLFLLNNDTACAGDVLPKLIAMAEARPELGALAPKMLLFDQPDRLNSAGLECSIIGAAWDRGIGQPDGPEWDAPGPCIGVCGGAWLIRAQVLEKTGLLPEDFEIYLDDLDLCLRIWNAGYEIWTCPEAVVRHKFSATLGEGKRFRRKYFLNTRNRFYLMLRNFPLGQLPRIAPAVLRGEAKAIGRALLDRELWRVSVQFTAWILACRYIPRALAERKRRARDGINTCKFWHLIRRQPLFSPGIQGPDSEA